MPEHEFSSPRLEPAAATPPVALWGGVECTRNRVGDAFFDQLDRGGHAHRASDIARIAALGVTAVRYPVLWERVAPRGLGDADWRWTDERLALLQRHGLQPIIGFVHHGAGPAATSLLDWDFADRLAAFGEAFARRYPHVRWFTPVNEPLTTARFSALYGHWHPHRCDDASFVRALAVQCQAVAETMRRIRTVRPDAALLQTEDAGRVYGTRPLQSQVRFENTRRWLTFDLLTGAVTPRHPLYGYLVDHGLSPARLAAFVEAPCPPDLLGLNYYVTSDRVLDHRWWRYPAWQRGGNGRLTYVDTEAVRRHVRGAGSHARVLRDAWRRYQRPMVLSEVHLAGHREDQLRWLAQAWTACAAARTRGIDVRALTVWSLFGAFGWDRLVTQGLDSYECGAFDVRGAGGEAPRPTAVARAVTDLATGGAVRHPAAQGRGWWAPRGSARRAVTPSGRPLLLVGGGGTLGTAFRRRAEARGLAIVAPSRTTFDAADPLACERLLRDLQPWAVVNAAGYCDVDAAESDLVRCDHANVAVPQALAAACASAGVPFVTFSSDLVFDGASRTPYTEEAAVAPLSAYGRAKAQAEAGVRLAHPDALIVRTSAFFGPWDAHNFAVRLLGHLDRGEAVRLPGDVVVSATYVPDLADAVLDLAIDGAAGTWHLASSHGISWFELGRAVAAEAGLDGSRVTAVTAAQMPWQARRPSYSVLTSARANLLPGLESCLPRFLEAVGVDRVPARARVAA